MDEDFITAEEICRLLNVSVDGLRQLRRGRDATRFPAPLLCGDGLCWYAQDVTRWLEFLADWRDAGQTREALDEIEPPVYLAAEPEPRTCARRNLN